MGRKKDKKKGKGKERSEETPSPPEKMPRRVFDRELEKLQVELCHLQEWVKKKGLRIIVVFEGRDAAGKGGVIKRILERVSPRIYRVVALPAPNDREKTQLYLQRYIAHFPAAGEIVLFDRSWYNRAGVERVMGFCTDAEYQEFMATVNGFEQALVRSGTILIKYWLDIADETQEERFEARIDDPRKRWKLSPMDLKARSHWVDYSKARDAMLAHTDTDIAPWWIVDANIKRHARLNTITHLLDQIPYQDLTPKKLKLPPRQKAKGYVPPDYSKAHFVPAVWPKE